MSPETYYVFAGAAGFAIGAASVYVWASAAIRNGALFTEQRPPRPWVVDGAGMWWFPVEGDGYMSSHDTAPPSPFSYDQVVAECGLGRIVPGGPVRLDAPPGEHAFPEKTLASGVGVDEPPAMKLAELPARRVVLPPPGFDD